MTLGRDPGSLRPARDRLVADETLRGESFGRALSAVVDDAMAAVLRRFADAPIALVALGSYARRELCPASDVDALLLYDGRADIGEIADAFWYPLWDAGFVLGHAARTAKECRALAATDLDTLTGFMTARVIGGARSPVAEELIADARCLPRRRRAAVLDALADAATLRRLRPGLVAEMLEPNVKEGAGGLRDLQALTWAGWVIDGPGGVESLVEADVLHPADLAMLRAANGVLLDARVALHRATAGHSDVLALQDQDAVAARLGHPDADAMIRDVAAAARTVAWVSDDAWSRLRPRSAGRSRRRGPEHHLAPGVVERDRRVQVSASEVDGALLVRVARVAAEQELRVGRTALAQLRRVEAVGWDDSTRRDLVALLRSGRAAVDVFEALDHENLVRVLLPEWEHVRFRPQRNAYHRFTVDRHLLETVAEAAGLLDRPDAPEARGASELEEPAVLLLGALLHDIAKGRPGDHAVVGARVAAGVGTRLGLPPPAVEDLAWLVREHLLMADTATRRDLADPVTVERFLAHGMTAERLRLLTLLTVADSRATGPAAWSPGKAALVRELHDRAAAAVAGRPVAPEVADAGLPDASLAGPGVVVRWQRLDDGRWRAGVGAPDRPGLLADVAGALSLEGFDIASAEGHSMSGGRAAEIFVGVDTFDRLATEGGRTQAANTIEAVLTGSVSVHEGIAKRRAAYGDGGVPDTVELRVTIVQDASADSTVVEVFAPDQIGLLAVVAGVFADLELDVTLAKVATTGELAVDVFYVRDHGDKLTDPTRLASLERRLLAALSRG